MHRDALELEGERACNVGLRLDLAVGEGLERRAVGPRVRHARVARDCLDERSELPWVAFEKKALDPAVLVAEVDLEVVHLLAKTEEAKRPRSTPAWIGPTATSCTSFPSIP